MPTALLLIAHGSREEDANGDLLHAVAELRRRGSYPIVEASFLELAAPSVEEAAARCVAQEVGSVVLLPYFLSAGVHVRRDLVGICARLNDRYPHVEFRLAEPMGRHPFLLDVLSDRARQAVGERPKTGNADPGCAEK